MQDSLIKSSLRSFLKAFFTLTGILLSFILTIALVTAFSGTEDEVSNDFTPEIQANADGVRKKMGKSAPVILELDINGIIGTLEMNEKHVENLLMESRENTFQGDRVKGLLVKINSPGGTINDADGIYRALLNYKARYNVPVFAFADGLCASGGMYVACAADKVYASDVTLVGSVGVITSSFMNVSELIQKIGISSLTVYAGKGKDELNPLRPWKPDEDKNIKDIIDYYYSSFVDIVINNRPNMNKESLVKEYGAKVFPAEQAAVFGYIDGAGESRDSCLKKLLAVLNIEDDSYQVVKLKSTNWLSQLINTKSPAFTGKVKHELSIDGQMPQELLGKPLYLYRP